jgi:hypothetical protein
MIKHNKTDLITDWIDPIGNSSFYLCAQGGLEVRYHIADYAENVQ